MRKIRERASASTKTCNSLVQDTRTRHPGNTPGQHYTVVYPFLPHNAEQSGSGTGSAQRAEHLPEQPMSYSILHLHCFPVAGKPVSFLHYQKKRRQRAPNTPAYPHNTNRPGHKQPLYDPVLHFSAATLGQDHPEVLGKRAVPLSRHRPRTHRSEIGSPPEQHRGDQHWQSLLLRDKFPSFLRCFCFGCKIFHSARLGPVA